MLLRLTLGLDSEKENPLRWNEEKILQNEDKMIFLEECLTSSRFIGDPLSTKATDSSAPKGIGSLSLEKKNYE